MGIFSRKKKEEVVQEMKAASQTIQPPYSSAGMYFWGLGGYHSDQFSNAIDAYCRNYALFACVTKIAKAVGGLEFELWGPKGKIDQHPILDMLYNPNLSEGSRSFYQRLTTHLLLAGNAYIYIAKSGQTGSLFLVNPIGMEVVIDSETGLIAGYKFKGKRIREFKKEEICHIRHPHPGNDYYGLPFYLPGQQLADILALTEKWNLALLHNDMRPPGIIVTDEPLGPTKKREIQTKFESEWAGAANAGRSVFLEGGLEWKPAGMTIKDADWVEMMKVYLRQMAALFDVPSELLGDSENKTYSNMKEARRAFYLETVLPLCDFIIDEFNRSIVPLWGKGMWLQIDRANIEALQDDWKERAQLVNQLDFLTWNEKRKYIGHEEIPGGDVVMGTFNQVPLLTVKPSGKNAKQSPTESTTKKTTKGDQFWAPRERKSILWKAYKSRTDRMAAKLEPAIDQ